MQHFSDGHPIPFERDTRGEIHTTHVNLIPNIDPFQRALLDELSHFRPNDILERNLEAIRHELDTPWRGHTDACPHGCADPGRP